MRPGSRLLTRRNINVLLNLALPALLVLSFVSGWVASLLGFTEFGLHKYSSLAVFGVACGHLGLHWRSLMVQVRRLRGHPRQPSVPPRLHLVALDAERRVAQPSSREPGPPRAA